MIGSQQDLNQLPALKSFQVAPLIPPEIGLPPLTRQWSWACHPRVELGTRRLPMRAASRKVQNTPPFNAPSPPLPSEVP